MANGIFSKVKNWIREDEEEFDEMEETTDHYEEEFVHEEEEELIPQFSAPQQKTNKIVSIHNSSNQLKVVISEPKKYEEVQKIADHLKQKKAVIVNLDAVEDAETRKSIFHFISGAVYVLEGSIQRVSKSIFILAPNNVDIDANIKKELESKVFFPWQSNK